MHHGIDDIKKICDNKKIIIVGNSINILKHRHGAFIDSHDIVIRMNHALPIQSKYYHNIGRKTDIYAVSIKKAYVIQNILKKVNGIKSILRLTPHGEEFCAQNIYFGSKKDYNSIKSCFNGYKPTTGTLVIDFFKRYIEYKKMTLIGFDFFKSMNNRRQNPFKSFLYKDHDPNQDKKYIMSLIDDKIELIKI